MLRNLAKRVAIMTVPLLIGSSLLCSESKYSIYIWGNGHYQARPDALLQFKNYYPKKIQNLPNNIIQLYFGQHFEAGIDNKGQLYVWNKKQIDSNYDQNVKDNVRDNIKMIQNNVKCVRFTQGFLWTLDHGGNVYQFNIVKKFDKQHNLVQVNLGSKKQVEPLKGTVSLECGRDHIIALNKTGQVWSMGDDTYGQCGEGDLQRNTFPPFQQKRIKYPFKMKNLSSIVKIVAGDNHNLALDKFGNLYGWGSNSSLQISHQQEFSKVTNPLICSFNPLKISKNLDNCEIKHIIAGGQFSVLVTENKLNNTNQVYTFGNNLHGQLGIDEVKHLADVTKVQKLSNYTFKTKSKQKKVIVDQLQCGKNHCIALLNIGYIMQWGDNQYGQLGNKKRSPSLVPIIVKDFVGKKIIGIYAGDNNTAVIIQEDSINN